MNRSVALLFILVFLTMSCIAVKPAMSSADVAAVVVVGAGLLVYLKKYKHQTEMVGSK